MKKLVPVLAVVVLLLLVFQWGVGIYNNMVRKQEGVAAAWSQVENVYQRRLDLIPNLVETVKGVANFEQETYTAVAEARSKAGQVTIGPETINDPASFEKFQAAQGELSSALSRLLVAVERYPELKANQNFLELQSQLEGTENRITVERRNFNETARDFNAYVKVFPNAFIAGFGDFPPKPYFEAAEAAKEAPQVRF
jgi:LemA protein